MKFALLSLAAVAAAIKADADTAQEVEYSGEKYYSNPAYVQADYTAPYDASLPGPDFNKSVYNFNQRSQTFDQGEYETRVKVEAELMVALESLKESITYLNYDLQQVKAMNDDSSRALDKQDAKI